jgi:hypothetical protein
MTSSQSTIPEEDSALVIAALKEHLSLQPHLLQRALDPQKAPPLPKNPEWSDVLAWEQEFSDFAFTHIFGEALTTHGSAKQQRNLYQGLSVATRPCPIVNSVVKQELPMHARGSREHDSLTHGTGEWKGLLSWIKLEEVRALRRATDCLNKDQLPSQSMIAYVHEKDFARRDMLRLRLECSEKTFMEAYLIPRICETTYKELRDMVMRRMRFHLEDSWSDVKEILLCDHAAQRTHNIPPETSSVVYIASAPGEHTPAPQRYTPRAQCTRCGRPGHSHERCWQISSRDGKPLHDRAPISRPGTTHERPYQAGPRPHVSSHEPPTTRPNVLLSASVHSTTPTFGDFCFMTTGPPHPKIRIDQTAHSTSIFESTYGAPSNIPEIAVTAAIPSYALPLTHNPSIRNITINQKQDTCVMLFDEDKPSLLPSKGIAFISGEHLPDLPCLQSMPVHRCSLHIPHWVSLCINGMVPILEGHLRAGGSIALFSACESTKTARIILQHRLDRLHDHLPDKFPPFGSIGWESRLPNSLPLIRPHHWDAIPSVDFLDSGPCSNISTSSARGDVSTIRPNLLQDILYNIRFLHDSQQSTLTYMVSSTTSSLDLPNIVAALGAPLRLEATSLGSTVHQSISPWTNMGQHWEILDH